MHLIDRIELNIRNGEPSAARSSTIKFRILEFYHFFCSSIHRQSI